VEIFKIKNGTGVFHSYY